MFVWSLGCVPWVQIRQPAVQSGRELVISDNGMEREKWDWNGKRKLEGRQEHCAYITVVQREQSLAQCFLEDGHSRHRC